MKRFYKLAALLLTLIMTFSLAGCGGTSGSSTAPGTSEPAKEASDSGKKDIVIYSPNEDYLIEFCLS